MANEIYNTSWWGNALDTARTAGTDPDFFGSQMKLLTSEQDNLVTNGTFDTDSDWTKVGNVTIQNGIAAFVDNGTNANSYIEQNVLTASKNYKVIIEVTRYVAGRIQIIAGSNTYNLNISAGTGIYKLYVESGSGTIFRIKRYGAYPNFDFDIDNVSVQLVRCDYDEVGDELVTQFDGVADGTDVATLTGWSAYGTAVSRNIVDEKLVIVTSGSNQGAVYQVSTQVGKNYVLTTYATGDLGGGGIYIDGISNVATDYNTVKYEFTALSTTTFIYFRASNNTAGTTTYADISLKEIRDQVEAKKCLADWIHRTALEDLKY